MMAAPETLDISKLPDKAVFYAIREAIKNATGRGAVEELLTKPGPDGKIPPKSVLDAYEWVPDPVTNISYPITLLGYAGYHGNIDMMDFLIEKGADVDKVIPSEYGTPLLQMLVYAYSQKREHGLQKPRIRIEAVKYFIDKEVNLDYRYNAGSHTAVTAVAMLIQFQLQEIAKLLVCNGADPLHGEEGDVRAVFLEHMNFGTNFFLKWLLGENKDEQEIPTFINRLFELNVFTDRGARHDLRNYGKNAAHAFLLCAHKEAIRCLVERDPTLLSECDPSGRMALQIAAEEGDTTSVKILLPHYTNHQIIIAEDSRSMTPLKLAAINGHEEVVSEVATGTSEEIKWALQFGYVAYFEAMHKKVENERKLTKKIIKGNTIAHLAAEKGNVAVFKATFPNLRLRAEHQTPCFNILIEENDENRTPLQIAISKGSVEMVKSVHERRLERKKVKGDSRQQFEENVEEKDWKEFWKNNSPKLLLYACYHGTVEIVDYFISHHVDPKTTIKGLTPLSCAAWSGKVDIIDYLLNIEGVTAKDGGFSEPMTEVPDEFFPLILASKCGHTKCVSVLLKRGANHEVTSRRKYNCLMEAIKAGHEDTAAEILKLKWPKEDWSKLMNCFAKKETKKTVFPLMLLIKEMPNVAGQVFTQCIMPKGIGEVEYDFTVLERYSDEGVEGVTRASTPPSWLHIDQQNAPTEKQDDTPSHPLALMVKHKRLELLQHPLISRYIAYKWWWWSFPLFLYLFLYLVFLAVLTTFALRTPRPGPENQYCPSSHSGSSYVDLNLRDGECEEPDRDDLLTFRVLAVVIIFLSIMFFASHIVFPLWAFYVRPGTPTGAVIVETILRPLTFILTIIFASGFMNECWCAPPWQWQIGALAVFMAYINFILMLKGMPWFGLYINMLLNIVITFVKLFYLAVLLILAFAFPFYMVFVRERASVQSVGVIEAFSTPAHSIAKTIMQVTGELDFENLFNEGNLLYSPIAYILFVSFVVLMPILFANLLVGLAVGTTDTDFQDATFKEIELRVNYVLALEVIKVFCPCGKSKRLSYPGKCSWDMQSWCSSLRGLDYETQKQLVEDLHNNILHGNKVEKENVTKVLGIQNSLVDYIDKSHQAVQCELREIRELLEEMTKKAYVDKSNQAVESELREIRELLEKLTKKT